MPSVLRVAKRLWALIVSALVITPLAFIIGCNNNDNEQVLYGPRMCTSDAECEEWNADGWYCDTDNVIYDSDGQVTTWAICRDGNEECGAVTLYGPQPCNTDAECQEWNSAGWYCDQQATIDDGCGNATVWPSCKESSNPCEPVTLYGPQPCQNDQECRDTYGSTYYCNTANTFSDGCSDTVSWPVCEEMAILYGPPACQNDQECKDTYGDTWYCDTSDGTCKEGS